MFQAFPCLCVMTTKRANHIYEHIFRVIENDFKLNITKAWIDYEVALRDAISKIYPHIVLKGFWYQFCLAIRRKCKHIPDFYETIWSNDASSLFHQFLCLPLFKENEIFEGYSILKRKSQHLDSIKTLLGVIDLFIRREGIENISIEWEMFGKQCSNNYNELLQQKLMASDSKFSLYNLLGLMVNEQIKIERTYASDILQQKYSPLTMAIKNIKEDLCKGKMDFSMFLNQLTFADNSYHVRNLDFYDIGDEHEYINDDADYYRSERNQLVSNRVPRQQRQIEVQQVETVRDDNCIVCLAVKRDTIVEPCNHLKFCFECIKTLHGRTTNTRSRNRQKPKCPLCRVTIESYKRVFL